MKSPFKFLAAYEKEDKAQFFGREAETETLYGMIQATRLLLVYGASGTGKSSLVNCGLSNRFPTTDWNAVFIRRKNNLPVSLLSEIERQVTGVIPSPGDDPPSVADRLSDAVYKLYVQRFIPLYLIFDQFEELYISGTREEEEAFYDMVTGLLDANLPCKLIFVIREEYLARLHRFEERAPNLFDYRFRVEKMRPDNLARVVTGTTAYHGIDWEEKEETVGAILRNLRDRNGEVDLTNLQVYLDRLYQEDIKRKGNEKRDICFDPDLVNKVGELKDVLGLFLDEQVKDMETQVDPPEMVREVLAELVTEDGTKRVSDPDEISSKLKSGKGYSMQSLNLVFRNLEQARIIHVWEEPPVEGGDGMPVPMVELSHDSLAFRIYEQIPLEQRNRREIEKFIRDRFELYSRREGTGLMTRDDLAYIQPYEKVILLSKEEVQFVRRSKASVKRRRQIGWAIAASVFLAVSVLAGWALMERAKFQQSSKNNRAQYLNTLARQTLATDPTKALRIAEEAMTLGAEPGIVQPVRKDAYAIYRDHIFYKNIIRKDQGIKQGLFIPATQTWAISLSPSFNRDTSESTVADDYLVYRYDPQGTTLPPLRGHSHFIHEIAVDEAGRYLVSASQDKTVRLWNLSVQKEVNIYRRPIGGPQEKPKGFTQVAISPNGQFLAGAESNSQEVYIWKSLEPNLFKTIRIPSGTVVDLVFSGTSNEIMAVTLDRGIWVFGLTEDRKSQICRPQKEMRLSAFDLGENGIVLGYESGMIETWNLRGDSLRKSWISSPATITTLSWYGGGRQVLAGTENDRFGIWSREGDSLGVGIGHSGPIRGIGGIEGTNRIYSVADSTVKVWQISSTTPERVIEVPFSSENIGAVTADGKIAVSVSKERFNGTIRTWDENGAPLPLSMEEGDTDGFTALALSGEAPILALGSREGKIYRWNIKTRKRLSEIEAHVSTVTDIAFYKSELLTASDDSTVHLWSADGKEIAAIYNSEGSVRAVAISPDGNAIAVASMRGGIQIFDRNGTLKKTLQGPKVPAYSLAWISGKEMEENHFVAGYEDGSLAIWNADWKTPLVVKNGKGPIVDLHSDKSGRLMVAVDYGGKNVQVWDVEGYLLGEYPHKGYPFAGMFFADGKMLLSSAESLYLWKLSKPPLETFLENGPLETFPKSH